MTIKTEEEWIATIHKQTSTKCAKTKRALIDYLKARASVPGVASANTKVFGPWGISLEEAYAPRKIRPTLWGIYPTYKHYVAYQLKDGADVPVDVVERLKLTPPPKDYHVVDGFWRKRS